MLEKIRLYFFNRSLQNRLRAEPTERRPGDFQSATSVGILFDAAQNGAYEIVRLYEEELKKQGKKVDLLGYIDDKGRHNDYDFKHFNQKDLNWFFQPKSPLVQQFMNKPFDILVCLFTEDLKPLEHVSALSKAQMRVGVFREGKTHCFDLMIDTSNHKDLRDLIRQMDQYLKIVNRKNQQYA